MKKNRENGKLLTSRLAGGRKREKRGRGLKQKIWRGSARTGGGNNKIHKRGGRGRRKTDESRLTCRRKKDQEKKKKRLVEVSGKGKRIWTVGCKGVGVGNTGGGHSVRKAGKKAS